MQCRSVHPKFCRLALAPGSSTFADAIAPPLQQRINLAWLVRLRWAAVVGQSLTIIAVVLLGVVLPLPPLLLSLAFLALSNVAIHRWALRAPQVTESHVTGLVACDIVLISLQLYFTGGASNPFHFLFLVHIALAAVTLGAQRLAIILLLACGCFFSLFWWYVPLRMSSRTELPVPLHGEGMAVAFVLAAALIVYFVHRVAHALRTTEVELARAREASERGERLSSLGTLAAGAAHELATPLATIALVAKEIERHLQANSGGSDVLDDTRLIRREVERCRTVLAHLASDAGASTGEPLTELSADSLVSQVLAELPHGSRVCLDWQEEARQARLRLPSRGITHALRSVVKNAWQAAAAGQPQVHIRLRCVDNEFIFQVLDNGPGIPPDVLRRVGEPFFTTKQPGEGMGLGLFLTRTVLLNTGGTFELGPAASGGTVATVRLPIAVGDAS